MEPSCKRERENEKKRENIIKTPNFWKSNFYFGLMDQLKDNTEYLELLT